MDAVDLWLIQGEIFSQDFSAGFDLTSAQLQGQIRLSSTSPYLLATFTSTVTNPTLGLFNLSLTIDQIDSLVPIALRNCRYDLFIKPNGGTPKKVMFGHIGIVSCMTHYSFS
jgi:hypothetical protein